VPSLPGEHQTDPKIGPEGIRIPGEHHPVRPAGLLEAARVPGLVAFRLLREQARGAAHQQQGGNVPPYRLTAVPPYRHTAIPPD